MTSRLADELRDNLLYAEGTDGVAREILLLQTLNRVFDQYATREADWAKVHPVEYRRWREQIAKLLNWLDFLIDSADHYAPEPSTLRTDIDSLLVSLERIQNNLEKLRKEKEQAEATLGGLAQDQEHLETELGLLQALRELLPWRTAVLAEFGEARLRSLSDARLVSSARNHQNRLRVLSEEIAEKLAEQERLLSEDLLMREQEWDALRQRIAAPPASYKGTP